MHADQRAQLLGGDHLVDRIVHRSSPGSISSSVESLSPASPGGRARERDVLVQRGVLVAGRGLDRGDDLARDAQLGEVAEARLAVGAVVADRLVQADEALLDQIVGVAAGEEVRRGLEPDEAVVTADEAVVRVGVALLREGDQEAILNLRLSLRARRRVLPRATSLLTSAERRMPLEFVARHLPWRRTYCAAIRASSLNPEA